MSQVNSSGRTGGKVRYWEPPLVVTGIFLVFVVARYMQWGARKDILSTIRIEFVLGLILSVSCAFLLSSAPIGWNRVPAVKRVITGIVLLFVSMIVQIPFAADGPLAQQIFVDRVIKFAMLTFFMVVLIRSPKVLRWFLIAFLFGCFYVTQESTRGAIGGGLVWENQGIMRLHGAVPIYRHPNSLAGLAIGVVPFIVFLLPVIKRLWIRLLMLAPLGTACICLLYSGSRTGYVAFFTFLVFWWSQSRSKMKWLLLGIVLSATVFPLLPDQYVDRFKSIGGQEAEGHSKEARLTILEDAMSILIANPIGVGVASLPTVREEVFGRTQDTHNLYLEVATNLGVQGLMIFLFLITMMLQQLYWVKNKVHGLRHRIRQLNGTKRERLLVKSLNADLSLIHATANATIGFLVVRLSLGLFGMDLYEVYWWFAAGLAISLGTVVSRLGANVEQITRELGETKQ